MTAEPAPTAPGSSGSLYPKQGSTGGLPVIPGASGFGIGSALYKPGMDAAEVGDRARAFVNAWTAGY